MPKSVAMFTLESAWRSSKSFYMWGITTFTASVFWTCMFLWILMESFICLRHFFFVFIFLIMLVWRLSWFVSFILFSWNLLGGNSVLWCLIRFTWVACGSLVTCLICLAVACELSILLAICLTLLAGNLCNSACPSFKVLDTNHSSFKKNQ